MNALIKSRNNRRNQFRARKAELLGISDLSSKLFQPLIEGQEKAQKTLEAIEDKKSASNDLPPLPQNLSDDMKEIFPRLLSSAGRSKSTNNSFLKFKERANNNLIYSGTDKLVSVTPDGYIRYLDSTYTPDRLTPGLAELLFINKFDDSKVTEQDVKTYANIMKTKLDNDVSRSKRADRIGDLISNFGEGLKVYIPNSVKEVWERLHKLLAAKKEGHTNSYNEINALLKFLLEQKEIDTKKYKEILDEIK